MLTDISIRIYGFVTNVLHREEKGQDLLEYVLLGGLIAAAIIALAVIFNPFLANMATNIGECLDFDNATTCNPGF